MVDEETKQYYDDETDPIPDWVYPPTWAPFAVPTDRGWVHPDTGELLSCHRDLATKIAELQGADEKIRTDPHVNEVVRRTPNRPQRIRPPHKKKSKTPKSQIMDFPSYDFKGMKKDDLIMFVKDTFGIDVPPLTLKKDIITLIEDSINNMKEQTERAVQQQKEEQSDA